MFTNIIQLVIIFISYVYALSPLSLTKPVTDGFGVQIHFTHPKVGEMEMIAEAGFKWVRMDFFWSSTEKQKGVYNFKEYEDLMSELDKHNMSALLELDFGNTLYDKSNAVTTEEGRKAYARWSAAAVQHFKGRGIVWEIWNEPNGNVFWNNHSDVQQYIYMALEAVKAIRDKTPNEIIIGPAMAGFDFRFQEECFKAGLLDYWDAVSVHPYRQTGPENVDNEYFKLKSLITKYAPKGKTIPIISGEWGYSSVWYNFNDTIQAKYLPRELLTNVLNNIPISIWYDWHNDGTNKSDQEHNFGTVQFEYHSGANPVYTPKESYFTAKALNQFLNGFNFVKRIATNDVYDYVMLFKKENTLRLAVWTTYLPSHQITIPSDKCDFEIFDTKRNKIENISSTNGTLALKVTDSPTYIIVKGPNHGLENSTNSPFLKAIIEPIHGKKLFVRISNLYGTPMNGSIRLTDVEGIDPIMTETNLQFLNENEKVISFSLKSMPKSQYRVGLQVNCGSQGIQSFKSQEYIFLSNSVFNDSVITADGDSKLKSEQSITVDSAPEPLYDSDASVLKIDYHFYGKGWKYLNVWPQHPENRKISGHPKSFGYWIFGDSQEMTIYIRLRDSTQQTFQLSVESLLKIDWKGWKYVRFNINDIQSHWGGSNDSIIHYPIEWETMFLLEKAKDVEIKSTIYITLPVIIY